MTLKFSVAPSPLNALIENIAVPSEAFLNKLEAGWLRAPLALAVRGDCSLRWDVGCAFPRTHYQILCVNPASLRLQPLRSIKELEYSRTLRAPYTNAANIVAIHCYQFVRLLPARVVSVIITSYVNHLLIILFLPRFDAWLCANKSKQAAYNSA